MQNGPINWEVLDYGKKGVEPNYEEVTKALASID